METATGKKTRSLLPALVAAVLVLGIAASCTLSALALRRISEQGSEVTELAATLNGLLGSGSDTVTQENDVAVAGEYWIRSTEPISDAYISGDSSELDKRQAETLKMASEVLDEVITEGMTAYEKEKAVYDWMCANLGHESGITTVIPTASEYSAEPYGVLKYGQAVCVGYATTFRLFMQMLGLDCMVVHNSFHSWDLVKLDDGEWYHVDIYSDVGEGNYANFNMTDELASYGHDWDTDFYPAASGLDYCYAYMNAEPLEDVFDLPQLLREALDAGGSQSLYFMLSDTGEDNTLALEEMLSRLGDAVTNAASMAGRDVYMDYFSQYMGDGLLVSVTLNEYGAEPEPVVDDGKAALIDEAIAEYFGDVSGGWEDYPVDGWTVDAMPVPSAEVTA